MIVQKCVPDEQTLARDRQHHWRTAFAGKRWRPRYPLPSQHLCRARLRFSRQCQSNIDNHIPQINPSIREPCLENLGRTLPSDEPIIVGFAAVSQVRGIFLGMVVASESICHPTDSCGSIQAPGGSEQTLLGNSTPRSISVAHELIGDFGWHRTRPPPAFMLRWHRSFRTPPLCL
ncbi:hypothetical protein CA85_52070 [Allorhodopirellula solitaria]|uniref:Uncharacterized protein n=1 Tax=Allorhodopirellula solitaria TaxID=2527987 RepID=A0A5C5WLL5_9BACT|nr:hypothetical protein CA85_52070 [Allorhodopirellula solitaria]